MSEQPVGSEIGSSTGESVSLEALMQRYQQADAAATEMLLKAVAPLLSRFFNSLSDGRHAADDLVQDTLLRMHRALHTWRPGEPLMPWVYSIARHTRVDHFRKVRRRMAHEESVESVVLQAQPAPVAKDVDTPDFKTLMGYLPESQREVLTMLKVMGMTVEEVARATSTTAGAVKQKAHRAYDKLRGVLEGMNITGGGRK